MRDDNNLVKLYSKTVRDLKVYSKYLTEHKPGNTVKLTIERDGKSRDVELTLSER